MIALETKRCMNKFYKITKDKIKGVNDNFAQN